MLIWGVLTAANYLMQYAKIRSVSQTPSRAYVWACLDHVLNNVKNVIIQMNCVGLHRLTQTRTHTHTHACIDACAHTHTHIYRNTS